MVKENELQKLKEKYPDFFKKTSPEVIDFALSEETASKIADICVKNGVNNEEQIGGIAYRVVWVLLGKLPSGNLAMVLELGVGLAPETAKKIADEANQFISSSLVKLKSGGTVQPKKELPKEKIIEEEPKRPPGKDLYHEPVE